MKLRSTAVRTGLAPTFLTEIMPLLCKSIIGFARKWPCFYVPKINTNNKKFKHTPSSCRNVNVLASVYMIRAASLSERLLCLSILSRSSPPLISSITMNTFLPSSYTFKKIRTNKYGFNINPEMTSSQLAWYRTWQEHCFGISETLVGILSSLNFFLGRSFILHLQFMCMWKLHFVCNNITVNSHFVDTLLLTCSYYGQELKSQRIRTTQNNTRYYGFSLVRTPNLGTDSVHCNESWLYFQIGAFNINNSYHASMHTRYLRL